MDVTCVVKNVNLRMRIDLAWNVFNFNTWSVVTWTLSDVKRMKCIRGVNRQLDLIFPRVGIQVSILFILSISLRSCFAFLFFFFNNNDI